MKKRIALLLALCFVTSPVFSFDSGSGGFDTPNYKIDLKATTAPPLSSAGSSRIYFDLSTLTTKISQNGGAYSDIGGLGSTPTFATVTVNTEAYDATGWDADLTVPTKDAVRDKIEGLSIVSPFSTASSVTYLTTTANYMSVGGSAKIGKLGITGTEDQVQGEFDSYSTQTNPVIRAKGTSGSSIFEVSALGVVTMQNGSGTPSVAIAGSSSGTATIVATAAAGTPTITLPATSTTIPIASQVVTISGPTAARTYTFPDASTTVVGLTDTQTVTNKRVTRRDTTTTQSATPTINTDNTDHSHITGLAQAITSFTSGLSGTPVAGDTLWIDITDNGTARAITWGTSFEASGNVALPTTTVLSVRLDVGFVWNEATSKWRCIAVA